MGVSMKNYGSIALRSTEDSKKIKYESQQETVKKMTKSGTSSHNTMIKNVWLKYLLSC